ncbi:hypothetical protein PENSTE_c017G04944 [Penicillium steckii]|uniref:Uncharacterized protein n=1 Tax=Penicillium steckii TaxID=303698 RepID=A0A1V6SYA2_9EURO|nr:hypothetical protein PENSTE_c017G04944 [Penicillium steckii]
MTVHRGIRTNPQLRDNVSRTKASSPVGKLIFVGLRAADVLWQSNLLCRGWGIQLIEKVGGSSLKQIVHIACVPEQAMDASSGLTIALFITIFNTINTLLSLGVDFTSCVYLQFDKLACNSILSNYNCRIDCLYCGLLVEATSEFQRKWFKQDPENRGKPYGGGLFSLATNINYGAYTT